MMDRLITININGVHEDERKELRDYLEDNCWNWKEEVKDES